MITCSLFQAQKVTVLHGGTGDTKVSRRPILGLSQLSLSVKYAHMHTRHNDYLFSAKDKITRYILHLLWMIFIPVDLLKNKKSIDRETL